MYTYSQLEFLKSVRVAGKRLVPFTLAHADVLCGIKSPLYSGSVESPEDLAVALFVCSRTADKARRQIRSGRAVRILNRMGRTFGRMSRERIREIFSVFRDYLATYSAAPPRWESGEPGSVQRAPWHLSLFCMIHEHTNLTAGETWDLTVSRALELCAVIVSNLGDKGLVSPSEMELFEKMTAGDQQGEP